jgi:hypothetical protein
MRIHPGSFEDDIQADLFEININKPPKYEALSYTWGNETGLEHVYINGYHVLIRRNLFNFLRRLRYDDEPRVVWVDAISISQQDLVEKGLQVAMIGDIFRAAEQICVWLGEHADSSEELFLPCTRVHPRQISVDELVGDAELAHRVFLWHSLLSRRYFQRRWIVQEIILARAVTVYCGDSWATWSRIFESRCHFDGVGDGEKLQFFEGIPLIKDFEWTNPELEKFRNVPYYLCFQWRVMRLNGLIKARRSRRRPVIPFFRNFQRRYGITEPKTLSNLLNDYHDMDCSDPRDHVYALLALEQPKTSIRPDYTIDVAQLCFEACVASVPVTIECPWEWLSLSQKSCTNALSLAHGLLTYVANCRAHRRKLLELILDVDADSASTEENRQLARVFMVSLDRWKMLPDLLSENGYRSSETREEARAWLQSHPDWSPVTDEPTDEFADGWSYYPCCPRRYGSNYASRIGLEEAAADEGGDS